MTDANGPVAARPRLLIEDWLPIAEIGEESLRERRSMTALPPTYYLHVWWARRPLVASRAAILASLLPSDADRQKFLHLLGIHGDPVAAKARIAEATRDGIRLGKDAYGYPRAFSYSPDPADRKWAAAATIHHGCFGSIKVLDPTAGGGSIPFEANRLGVHAAGNDLNPVAWFVLKTTVDIPARRGMPVLQRYRELGQNFVNAMRDRLHSYYPAEPLKASVPDGYLWARTVHCPYCGGLVPLSPNWRLDSGGTGVKLVPHIDDPQHRHCTFEIVHTAKEQSAGTVKSGQGLCPYPDCGRVFDGNEIKSQAQAGEMGDQLYAVVYKQTIISGKTKTGNNKVKTVRGFRAPRSEDDVDEIVAAALAAKMPEWEARNIVPDEAFPVQTNDARPLHYGMLRWRDMFNPRQLLGHCTSVEVFHDMVDELREQHGGELTEIDKAALAYIAIAIDKVLNYNARMVRWHANRQVVAGAFDRHDFAFKWSYAEMAPTIVGLGYD